MPSQVRIAVAVTARRPQSSRLDPDLPFPHGPRGGQPTRCSVVLFLRWAAAD